MNGPLSPEELARMQAYYGANASNASPVAAPAMSDPAQAPPPEPAGPEAPVGSYWGLPSMAIPAGAPPPTGLPEPPPEPQIDKYGNPLTAAQVQKPLFAPSPPAPPKPLPTTEGNGAPIPEVVVPSSVPPQTMMRQPGVLPAGYREIQAHTAAGEKPRGGPGNPDPFGTKAANAALMGTYGEQRRGIEHQAAAEGAKALTQAEGTEQLARRMTEDAAIDRAQSEIADKTFAEHMTEVQRQIDDLREKKIDPTRKLNDKGLGILSIIAGVAGGIYQGANHLGSNPFLDDLHRTMNEDIQAQEASLANGRAAVGDQLNLLGQMRAVYKDKQLADMQARNLIYEATKQGIEAEAGRSDDGIIRARAEQAVATVNREQALLQKQIAEQARAQAAASAAQQMAQVKAARERLDAMYQATFKDVMTKTGNPEQAEYEAQRMVSTLMGSGAGPGPRPQPQPGAPRDLIARVPEKQQEHAAKELETHAKAQKAGEEIDALFAEYKALPPTAGPWDKDRAAIEARILAAYKQGLGPDAHLSSDNDAKAFLEPLKPEATESDATTAHKAAMIKRSIEGSYATPILDTHNPGWKGPPPVKHYDASGKPK